ncbi:GntR family transcriptional regulator [Pelagibius sp.]|uniref:GntR family transcriptional regulator n=1 Tax=Pelagibius sp. TaxID=1931238 RepID=UPI003BB1FEB6
MKKLEDMSLSDRAYEALREDIIAGRFQPGKKITIASLSKEFGVSPTPVREAIRLLLAQGALDLKPNHSVTVVALTADEYREIARIRIELEGMAAAEAAILRTEAQAKRLRKINDDLEAARAKGRYADVLRRNRAFHFALPEMARLSTLTDVLEMLWLRSGPLLNVLYDYDYDYRSPLGDHPHEALVDAIERQDSEVARAAIQRDIQLGTEVITAHLDRLEAPARSAS